MKKFLALFVALFVYLGALFAPAMGASLLTAPEKSQTDVSSVTGKKSQKKKCKKLKKKIKKAKSKKAKKKAKKKYKKKCKCKKLKKKAKKAKSPKKRKRAQKKYARNCKGGSGGSGGSGGGGGGGAGGGNGGGGTTPPGEDRVAEGTYANPSIGIGGLGYSCGGGGCVEFPVESSEMYVSIVLTDDSGQPVAAALAQDTDGDGVGEIFGSVCGESATPVPITPGIPLTVVIGAGVVIDAGTVPPGACPSVATSGTVKATFSNQP